MKPVYLLQISIGLCEFAAGVQAAARFTPLQRQQLLALRATFLREMDEVVAERRVLTQGIKV